MRRAAGIAVVLVVAAVPATAAADPHPMSSGANPAPTTDAKIAMTSETLTIDLEQRAAAVRAVMMLENQGPATKLLVGFPCAKGEAAGQVDVPCKVPLAITVGGKQIRAKQQRSTKTLSHWTWPMKLAAGEKLEVVVAYRAPLVNDRYSVPAYGMGVFTYRLTTGARWAGPIGKLSITVNHMHEPLLYVSPAGYARTPGQLTWTLDNHEPVDEVVILPHPLAGNRFAGSLGAKTAAAARAKLAAGDYEKQMIEEVLGVMRDERDEMTEWPRMISRLGGVPPPPQARVTAVRAESVKQLEALAKRAKR